MRKNLSKKMIAMGLAVMMAVQTPAMAAEVETLPEASAQETVQETAWEETELQTEETKQQIEETQPQTLVPTEATEFETQDQTEEQMETTELKEIETEEQTEPEAQNTPTQEEIITESATETEAELESEAISLIEESEELEVLSEVQTYAMPTEEQNKELADKVEEIIQYLNLDGKADYDKIFAIYKYVCQNVEYDWEILDRVSEWDGGLGYGQLAYEALCEGKAVCAGIARAVNLLMNRAGISSYYVVGTNWGIGHAWNLVELNGEYYFVDATSDLNQDTYKYFLKCEADFSEYVYTSIEGLDDVSSIKWAEKSYYDTVEGSYEKVGDFLINGGKGDIIIHSYVGHDENVVVPAEINGRKVKSITQDAFYNNAEMRTLTISEGVEKLNSLMIEQNPNLVKISLPASARLVNTSSSPFALGITGLIADCKSLEIIEVPEENPYFTVIDNVLYNKNLTALIAYPAGSKNECVEIPEGITTIKSHAFSGDQYLKKVVFPDSVTVIDYWAFFGCSALEEINIPANCKVIGQYTFDGTAIKHIKIPATVVNAIVVQCFQGTQLEIIEVEEGNPYYHVENGALYAENDLLLYASGSKESEVVVSEGIEFICSGAFYEALNLKKITIASTVKTIADHCFGECAQLEEVSIKEGKLETIDEAAFLNCYTLRKITIPKTVNVIGKYAFAGCWSLNEVILPEGLQEINEDTFFACQQLTTIGIPASVTVIKTDAFREAGVKNIYYAGSEEEWEKIDKGNNDFTDCRIFFNGEICDHIWSDEFTVDKEPTCNETGEKSIHCTVCGLKKVGSEQTIPAQHEFGKWSIIMTTTTVYCETVTSSRRYCKRCGYEESKVTSKFNHELVYYSGVMADEKIEFWHCNKCNSNFSDEQGTDHVWLPIGWIEMSDGKHYIESGWVFVASRFLTLDGDTYYFDENGIMQNDTELVEDGVYYYFGSDGKLECKFDIASDGWKSNDNSWYYVKNGQILKSQWLSINGFTYYLGETGKMMENEECWLTDPDGEESHLYRFGVGGAMITGWYQLENGNWQYLDENGIIKTDWVYLNGIWYYLDSDGIMTIGWKVVNGTWYFFERSGAMATGWLSQNGVWYYMTSGGAMATGWLNLNGTWYYMTSGGAMATGWLNLNGTWYYMTSGGAMATGWCLVGNSWYYLSERGAMVTGWLNLNGTWYYMGADGAMLTGTQVIGGITYVFNQDGAWVEN